MVNRFADWGKRAQTLVVLAALVVLLGVASPHFLSPDNLLNVTQQSAINAILGIGLTFVIISGGINLSVGSLLALCGLITADLLVQGAPTPVAAVAGLGAGLGLGAVNGLVTTWGRIPPFITTLGMMLVARSAAAVYSGSTPISGLPAGFAALAGTVAGVPVFILAVAALYAAAHFVLNRTKLGRYAYAIGGNEQAAWLSGVPTARYKVAIYALSGGCAGIAAVLLTARLNAASPLAGEMYELYAIAAAVIGGTSLMGGEGRISGTLIGALVMGVLRNGLNLLNVPSSWEGVVVGTVLVAAVIVDRSRHRIRPQGRAAGWRRHRARIGAALLFTGLLVAAIAYRMEAGAASGPATLTVAFVPKQIGSPFWVTMRQGAEAEARRLGVRLVTLAADRETDVERQHQIIENLIEQRVAALVVAPAGAKEVVPAVRKANQAGIPVLIVDSDIHRPTAASADASTVTYIGSDNFEGGRLAGQAVARWLDGQGEVAVLEGTPGHDSTDQRRKGFAAALAESPGLRIVASQTASAERARGFTVSQNILQAQPNLRAIFAANDEMALGAVEAVAAAGRAGKVRVVGFDASPDALANIRSGRMDGSIAQFPGEMGRLGVLTAVTLIQTGARPEPVLHTRVQLINRSNVDGFAPAAPAMTAPSDQVAPTQIPRLTMRGIDKSFPGVFALRGASLSVVPGEVHVLLGENGAGKSTLMKILGGQHPMDAGAIALDGVPFVPRSPLDAQRRGIATIHQELSSILPLTVAENILLGDEPARGGVIDASRQADRARSLLQAIGAQLDPDALASSLSVAQLQLVEIAKALRHQARVLIMDEPTAALTDAETDKLFGVIRGLTARGVAVVYISHRMPEIFALGDRVTVMRDGATVSTVAVADTTVAALIAAMVGRQVEHRVPKRPVSQGSTVLEVQDLRRGQALGPITFAVRAGEIFGLAGLMGSGRTELARAVFGADPTSGGQVLVNGRRLTGTVGDAIAAGVGFVTEDRKVQGLVLDCSAAANMTLAVLSGLTRGGVIDLRRETQLADGYRDRLRIRLPSVAQLVRTLSGGNQQKVIIARWLAANCRVLLLDEPTRGVDVGAETEIYELIGELAERGVAILLISSDLPEVLGLADRVGVMRDGKLAGILDGSAASPQRVMALAVG